MLKRWDETRVRNIGISAHIDSGKTTLTERVLYYTGKIHAIHDVRGKDGVGAKMDSMELEKERGITIQSAATNVKWKNTEINIIDTPGHVDFTIEVERALRVLDGAILVLCGVAGVQSQSITVDRQMRRYNVARIAFINKLDRSGANPFRVNEALKEKLKHNTLLLQIPIGLEEKHKGVVDLVKMKAFYFEGSRGESVLEEEIPEHLMEEAKKYRQELIAQAADFDEELADKYLTETQPTEEELKRAIRKGTLALKATPVLCGSAFKNKGVQLVLDAVHDYLPHPGEVSIEALDQEQSEKKVSLSLDPEKPLVALAFKLEDGRFGQLTYLRIYQGTLKKGEFIYNVSAGRKKLKVPRLVQMHANEMEDVDEVFAGDIVALFGAECSSGDTFTDGKVSYTMTSMFVPDPVISLAVRPKEKSQGGNFSKALSKFQREDPTFRVHRDRESNETIVSGMGELHLDVYIERIKREFGVDVISGEPQVAYRETISKETLFEYTHKKQTGGAGQFAKVMGNFVPLPLNSEKTYEFVNKIKGGNIPREFIPACDKGFQEEMKKGPLIGAPIVGVQVNLMDGAYHDVDSSEIAFRLCAMAAFREFYFQAGPRTLEPMMKLEVSVPEEFQGNVMGQINQRRGLIQGSQTSEGFVTIEALVPLAEMFGYSTDLRSATQGKGEFTMEFSRYSIVPKNIQEELIKEYAQKKALEAKSK